MSLSLVTAKISEKPINVPQNYAANVKELTYAAESVPAALRRMADDLEAARTKTVDEF